MNQSDAFTTPIPQSPPSLLLPPRPGAATARRAVAPLFLLSVSSPSGKQQMLRRKPQPSEMLLLSASFWTTAGSTLSPLQSNTLNATAGPLSNLTPGPYTLTSARPPPGCRSFPSAATSQLVRHLSLQLIAISPSASAWSRPSHATSRTSAHSSSVEHSDAVPEKSSARCWLEAVRAGGGGTRLTTPTWPLVPAASRTARLDLLTKSAANPEGSSPTSRKKEHTMKSGRMRERPSVSVSLGPSAHASSSTCQPFSCASRIQK
ncbi:putative molybdenum cofactor sulfurase 3 [Iris pallida]|uniref:Molybdenum cofactor sulfurase 3 n=1 Tax=Iris pallida TaxID=29817 RepID=A0AAX6HEJ8_IRIPA|nr:putative molybdenum cofactor sulfurase 3 [Iris pallida]